MKGLASGLKRSYLCRGKKDYYNSDGTVKENEAERHARGSCADTLPKYTDDHRCVFLNTFKTSGTDVGADAGAFMHSKRYSTKAAWWDKATSRQIDRLLKDLLKQIIETSTFALIIEYIFVITRWVIAKVVTIFWEISVWRVTKGMTNRVMCEVCLM